MSESTAEEQTDIVKAAEKRAKVAENALGRLLDAVDKIDPDRLDNAIEKLDASGIEKFTKSIKSAATTVNGVNSNFFVFSESIADYCEFESVGYMISRDSNGWYAALEQRDDFGSFAVTIQFNDSKPQLDYDDIRKLVRIQRDKTLAKRILSKRKAA